MDAIQEVTRLALFSGVQDSKAQVTALQLIVGTLQRTRVFGMENRDTLTHKATGVNTEHCCMFPLLKETADFDLQLL